MRGRYLHSKVLFLAVTILASRGRGAPLPQGVPTLRTTLTGHTNGVDSAAFSADGNTLASVSADKQVKLWNVADEKETATLLGHPDYIQAVAWSPNGNMLATSGYASSIILWDTARKKGIAAFRGATTTVPSVAFSKDGKLLASGGHNVIEIWDTVTLAGLRAVRTGSAEDPSGCLSLTCTPEGKWLAVCASATALTIWDVFEEKKMLALKGIEYRVSSCCFSPDCKTLASVGPAASVKFWDLSTGKSLATFEFTDQITGIAFRPDGKMLALGHKNGVANTAGHIRLIDLTTNKEVAFLKAAHKRPCGVAFSPDGRLLASFSADDTIKLWNIPATIRPEK